VQGKILIVDGISTNRIVLKTKLSSSYYNVLQATSVAEAIAMASSSKPDLVVTALCLPDGDAALLCTKLAMQPLMGLLPVLVMADAADPDERQTLLASGAQDVLIKPVPDTLLLSRVRSLIRARHSTEDWVDRTEMTRSFALFEAAAPYTLPAHFDVVSDDKRQNHCIPTRLRATTRNRITASAFRDALQCLETGSAPDAFVLVLSEDMPAALEQMKLISLIRANSDTRGCGVLILDPGCNADIGATALDLGGDDLMQGAFDPQELLLRLTRLTRAKRRVEHVQRCVAEGLREAVIDPLTGLHNRRYAAAELDRLTHRAAATGRPFAVMLADMDYFKRINDRFGHAAGDAVLVEAASRLRAIVRDRDMVARIGGEEFLIATTNTSEAEARMLAERICKVFRDVPFVLPDGMGRVTVTLSIGIFMAPGSNRTDSSALIEYADRALYSAKHRGRNCVRLIRSAA
jgi:two-component system, cell cycle response regulator